MFSWRTFQQIGNLFSWVHKQQCTRIFLLWGFPLKGICAQLKMNSMTRLCKRFIMSSSTGRSLYDSQCFLHGKKNWHIGGEGPIKTYFPMAFLLRKISLNSYNVKLSIWVSHNETLEAANLRDIYVEVSILVQLAPQQRCVGVCY